jgi:hypothetical protein
MPLLRFAMELQNVTDSEPGAVGLDATCGSVPNWTTASRDPEDADGREIQLSPVCMNEGGHYARLNLHRSR